MTHGMFGMRLRLDLWQPDRPPPPSFTANISSSPFLLDVFQHCAKDFTLVTKSRRYSVLLDVICGLSPEIAHLRTADPGLQEFDLRQDISDSIMARLVSVFNGGSELFVKSEYAALRMITSLLRIGSMSLPIFLTSSDYSPVIPYQQGPKCCHFRIAQFPLGVYVGRLPRTFLIRARSTTYSVPMISLGLSEVLNEHRNEAHFCYECDDDSIGMICDYLCCQQVRITPDNMAQVRATAADLRIESLVRQVDKYSSAYENDQKTLECQYIRSNDLTLQSCLLMLPELDIDRLSQELVGSTWFPDHEAVKEFVVNLLVFTEIRQEFVEFLAALVRSIHDRLQDDTFVGYLTRRLMDLVSNSAFCRLTFMLYEMHLIPIDTITHAIFASIIKRSRNSRTRTGMPYNRKPDTPAQLFLNLPNYDNTPAILCWFLPEMEKACPFLVRQFLSFRDSKKCARFVRRLLPGFAITRPPSKKVKFPIWRGMGQLREDDWKLLRELRSHPRDPNPLAFALANDDLVAFQTEFAACRCSPKAKIPACSFDNLAKHSLLGYAAEHRSLHCVRFLLMNQTPVEGPEMACAIRGGQPEIIRLFDEKYDEPHDQDSFPGSNPKI
jgi:hypothetical protein